jgi:hypothetical protein
MIRAILLTIGLLTAGLGLRGQTLSGPVNILLTAGGEGCEGCRGIDVQQFSWLVTGSGCVPGNPATAPNCDWRAAINTANQMGTASGSCTPLAPCLLEFENYDYYVSGTVEDTISSMIWLGHGAGYYPGGYFSTGTIITNTTTTTDTVYFHGTDSFCSLGSGIHSLRSAAIYHMTLNRVTPSTTNYGLNVTNGCLIHIEDVTSLDSLFEGYQKNSCDSTWIDFQGANSTQIPGTQRGGLWFEGLNCSTTVQGGAFAGINNDIGVNTVGIYVNGDGPGFADLTVIGYQTASSMYGAYLTSNYSGGPSFVNDDVTFINFVADICGQSCFEVNGVSGGDYAWVNLSDSYLSPGDFGATATSCAAIVNSNGVTIHDTQCKPVCNTGSGCSGGDSTSAGFIVSGASALDVLHHNAVQDGALNAFQLSGDRLTVTDNTVSASSGLPIGTAYAGASLTNSRIVGVSPKGSVTTNLSLDSASTGNKVDLDTLANMSLGSAGAGNVFSPVGASGAPSGSLCTYTGQLAINSAGTGTSIFYVCGPAGTWTGK